MLDHENASRLLTTPPQITGYRTLSLTGNEYLSLPEIGPGGEIYTLNVLHLGQRGLLEFAGGADTPLLAPFLSLDGRAVGLRDGAKWCYRLDWIPRFTLKKDRLFDLEGEIVFPPDRRGGCYRLKVTSTAPRALRLELGWRCCWARFNLVVFNRRPIGCERHLSYDAWTKSLVLEARCGPPLAALALALEPEGTWAEEQDGSNAADKSIFRGAVSLNLEPGQCAEVSLYLAANLEADGAGATAFDLRRHGPGTLAAEAEQWLKRRRQALDDPALEQVMNRNLFFNYFFALGRALDTDDLVSLTSRSPRYYVSGAFWSRDALLWSFPGILAVEAAAARELLLTVFRRHLDRAGEHAHYLNGVVLYPGFELDQLAAHFLALERYERRTGDRSLLSEELIGKGLARLVEKAQARRDAETGLYGTFLDPSDDPALYPFLVYDNALLQRGFAYLAALQAERRWSHPADFNRLAAELRRAIYRHGTVEGPCGTMFAWAVDGRGQFELYDNPPGSLQLLAYYGFCTSGEPVFKNTVSWIRSTHNPYFHRDGLFAAAGSRHCGNPWPLSAANALLAGTGVEEAREFFRRVPMDNGFCCETVDPQTGRVFTGAAFASAAGFLACALLSAGRRETNAKSTRPD